MHVVFASFFYHQARRSADAAGILSDRASRDAARAALCLMKWGRVDTAARLAGPTSAPLEHGGMGANTEWATTSLEVAVSQLA